MKKIILNIAGVLLIIFATVNSASAQDSEFLIANDMDIQWGGFGGPEVKFSEAFGEFGTFIGFKAGVVMNNLVIGGAAEALLSEIPFEGAGTTGEPADLLPTMGFGGLYSEYFLMRTKPVHFSASALVGPGMAWVFQQNVNDAGFEDDDMVEAGVFLAIQPAINIELNVIKPVKFYVTAGYRIVSTQDFERISSDDLSGLTLGFGLRLGKY